MPKQKTKKIVVKRYKVTANGKLMHRVQGNRHLRRNKSKARQRQQDKPREMKTQKFVRSIKGFMGGTSI